MKIIKIKNDNSIKESWTLDKNVATHEISHILFRHTVNEHWINRWEEAIGEYNKDDVKHFAYEYGKTNSREDMATIADCMFLQKRLQNLYKKAGESPILTKKIQVMKEFFEEISHGQMNEEYWQKIENGEINNAIDAQKYFDEIKAKQKSQL